MVEREIKLEYPTLEAARAAIGTLGLVYLNRLSDLLFVLSRWAARARSEPETLWRPE